jgi:hypothetical protein
LAIVVSPNDDGDGYDGHFAWGKCIVICVMTVTAGFQTTKKSRHTQPFLCTTK